MPGVFRAEHRNRITAEWPKRIAAHRLLVP
jgi:hypothetical protein